MRSIEFPDWLADSEPQLPLPSLVQEVNRLYHSFGAANYDREHPEIFQMLPAVWAEMIAQLPQKQWRVLDFGCGTGFEAARVQQNIGEPVEHLVCFDPSPEMLAQCRDRLKATKAVSFHAELQSALKCGPFNLLLTNSLLHHLPDIRQTLSELLPSLTADAMWLAGHEPSARFFRNAECLKFLDDFSRHRRWGKFLSPKAYLGKMRLLAGQDPLQTTARAALERGWFKKLPDAMVIDRIVDFHVPHSREEAHGGRGLDFVQMQVDLAPEWSLKWVKTYGFFGSFKPTSAPQRWVKRSRELAEKFPRDGANFAMVWVRSNGREPLMAGS